MICLWAIVLGSVVGFFLYGPTMDLIQRPYCDFIKTHPEKAPEGSDARRSSSARSTAS